MIYLLAALVVAATAFGWWGRIRLSAARRLHAAELEAERARGKAAVDAQEERTAALFDRMVEGLILLDAMGAVRRANRAAGNFFGFAPPATGRSLMEAVRHHQVADLVARLDREPEVLGQELRIERPESSRFVQVNALLLRDDLGRKAGAILVFHDVTLLRQLEALRQEFVANVSHELRTPLSLIKGAVETLRDGGRDDPVTLGRFLEIIERHADRLTLLIDDLLLLSTMDSGRLRLEMRPFPLRPAIQETLGDLMVRADARGVMLENAVPANLVVQADPDRIHQVLSNLLDNAIKYGKAGGHVTVEARELPNGLHEVCVRDDGPGIPVEAQGRIFERFYRVDKARSREEGGTGLGLAIVKHVVQAHGGAVRVESAPGAGAAFYFTLPSG